MGEWLVQLEGDPAELEELVDQFRSPELNVSKEGEAYYLRSSEDFGELTDAGEVRVRATELLLLLSGIANLYAGAGETVTPGHVILVRDDGMREVFAQVADAVRVRSSVRVWGTKATNPTVGESWLILARRDDDVLDVLRFFQEGMSWWSLRKAYEVIESEFGRQESRVAKKLSVRVNEIRRFKRWAHHNVHGGRGDPPDQDQYPVLSLAEADSFLRGLLRNWLRWKRDQQESSH
jgi:hypothetical protein